MVLLGFFFPRSKAVFCFELIALICFLGGYNGRGDLPGYEIRYNAEMASDTFAESLFYAVSSLLHRLGFSFEAYHFILTALSLLLIAYVICQLSEKPTMTIAFMWGYPTLEYALQLQGLCASAIVIYALYYYFKRIYNGHPRLRHYAVFLLLLTLCVATHFYAAFFVVFLLTKPLNKFTICCMAFLWFIAVAALLNVLFSFVREHVVGTEAYDGLRLSAKSFLCFCLWLAGGVWCSAYNSRAIRRHRYEQNVRAFSVFSEKGSFLMMLLFPFFLMTGVFERMFRIWIVFLYIQVSFLRAGKLRAYMPEFLLFVYSVATFILFYIIFGTHHFGTHHINYNVYQDVIRNNLFW